MLRRVVMFAFAAAACAAQSGGQGALPAWGNNPWQARAFPTSSADQSSTQSAGQSAAQVTTPPASQPTDTPEDVKAFLTAASGALRDGPATEFVNAFDPGTPGYAQIKAAVTKLLSAATASSRIDLAADSGDSDHRSMALDWTLLVESHDLTSGSVTRTARVLCKIEKREGKWRFTSFEAGALFQAPPGRQAWDVISAAAGELRNGNASGFMSAFDRAMPGYDQLRANVTALTALGDVESSLQLNSVEGSDAARELDIDWSMTVSRVGNPATGSVGISGAVRRQTIRCRVALHGKSWKIEMLQPLTFFTPAP